jgi:hypothetical protein
MPAPYLVAKAFERRCFVAARVKVCVNDDRAIQFVLDSLFFGD